jgi:RNA polymerase sigma-70 factor (ECF subfamily)
MFGFGKSKTENWSDFEHEAVPLMADVYRVAMWLVRDATEAEDLTQETFTQAFRSFHNYEIGTNCKAWLITILHNLNYKRLRKMNRLQLVEDVDEQIAQTIAFEPSIPQHLDDEEILEALKRIPIQYSQVVVLADVEEFAYKEISRILDVPIGTVMSRLSRGRKLLRGELAVYAQKFGINLQKKTGEMK